MNDERIRRWLPTWIPESLLLAEEERARKAREAQKEVTMDAVSWKVASALDSDFADTYPDDESKREKIRNSIRVSPQVSAETFLNKVWFNSVQSRKLAFFGKNVLDVGGWFSWLARVVSEYWAKVAVADPVFFEPDVNACFEKDLDTIRRLVRDQQERIAAGSDKPAKTRYAMEANLKDLERVHMEMFFWRWYDKKLFPAISRLAAFAENLRWVPDGSQDFVFATNVVGKPTLDVGRFHSELLRVLSPDGKVCVLDYDDPSAVSNSSALESLLRKTRPVASFSDGWHRIIIS